MMNWGQDQSYVEERLSGLGDSETVRARITAGSDEVYFCLRVVHSEGEISKTMDRTLSVDLNAGQIRRLKNNVRLCGSIYLEDAA